MKNVNHPLFRWSGAQINGERNQGEIAAKDLSIAKQLLRQQGIAVHHIQKMIWLDQWQYQQRLLKPMNSKQHADFSRQFATLIQAGIPLVQSLTILLRSYQQKNLQHKIKTLRQAIETGTSFHEALRQFPADFDEIYCSLIEAGEQSGTLDIMLQRIAHHREKTLLMRRKIRKALSYPIIVTLIAILVTLILLLKVIPQFETLFSNAGARLPTFTQIVINLSDFIQHNGLTILMSFTGLIILFIAIKKRSPAFRLFLSSYLLKLPFFGKLVRQVCIARIARTLSILLGAGLPLLSALTLTGKASGQPVYENVMIQVANRVHHGEALHQAMKLSASFPTRIIEIIAIGEETGELEAMISKMAEIDEIEIDATIDALGQLIEPFIMTLLGVIVGGLVIAMYLPIFNMGQLM